MTEYITVVGNIADVPVRRELPGGDTVARFRLAATTQRRQEDGAWVDAHTSWYAVSAYRRLGEHALASLEKGQRVIVNGRFRVRQWESNGKHGTDAEIDADALGHDLLFGTTSFYRDERNRVAARAETEQPSESGWAPSAGEQQPDSAAHPEQQSEESEQAAEQAETSTPTPHLVGVGGWDRRPLGDSTPF
ncbi:single-stranded DNA-binding protein [Microbacterium sp.]|uniref:single-stranded DNA-binding protein n=1 Tax=Microbacterium sp. TaxID=51671 RepID=UPI0025FCEA81|nr:single-stranded DNA-binding protein [Microbacterium sp.]